MTKVYRCKHHGYAHAYTVCPHCGCQYCSQAWLVCPRVAWHPAHGTTDVERGRRHRLEDWHLNRAKGERGTA